MDPNSRLTHQEATRARRARYLAPTLALTAAGVLLALSLLLPYWELDLVTPDHPGGLRLVSHLSHLDGPVERVLSIAGKGGDGRLRELDELERSLAVATGTVICLLVIAATLLHNRWAALLSLPALCFPAIVIADTARWLRPIVAGLSAGSGGVQGSASLSPFGRLAVDGMSIETRPGAGLIVAIAASLTVIVGLWLHRRAYKPTVGATVLGRSERARQGREAL